MMTVYVNTDGKYEIFAEIASIGVGEILEDEFDKMILDAKKKCSERRMLGALLINGEYNSSERRMMSLVSHYIEDVFVIDRKVYCHILLLDTDMGRFFKEYLDQYLTKDDNLFEDKELIVECVGNGMSLFGEGFKIERIDILHRG